MFRVSTVHLSADAATADPKLGTTELGEVSRASLRELLARLREVDESQIVDAEPHLVVTSPAGRFIVRTGRKKLFLYDARDSAQPYAELSAEEIVVLLERERVTRAPWPADEANPPPETAPAARRAAPHRGIAATILVAGLALNGYTLYSVFYTESVNVPPVVTLLTAPADIVARTNAVVGTYTTGDKPGDRTITVKADGSVNFSQLGSTNVLLNNSDTYKVGKRDDKFCLSTVESGVIEIVDSDTVLYYRDVYKRR
jgi:hypothetical protein